MESADPGDVTTLLAEFTQGNDAALELLIRQVYPELRRMAHRMMSGERVDHTLSATSLVHEGFLRLFGNRRPELRNSRHFFLTAAAAMRHVLTDHARAKLAGKRNGILDLPSSYCTEELFAIGELLGRLERIDLRAAQVVELRFYMGMTEHEAAAALGISHASAQQDWRWARAWLRAEMHGAWQRSGVADDAAAARHR